MEEHKLNEIAKDQSITERINDLEGQNGEQAPSSEADIEGSQTCEQDSMDDVIVCPGSPCNEAPSLQEILQFQLNQAQQQLWETTEERNKLLAKHTACMRRSVVLGMEREAEKKQSSIFRQQRNVFQARLDALEDQGIDIGKPRNNFEAEARVTRRQHREKMRFEGLAGAKIFPALNTNSEISQGTVPETELLNATDEMEGEVLVALLSPKARQDIDMLFEDSDEALSQTSPQVSPLHPNRRNTFGDDQIQAVEATSQQEYNVDMDEDMVYGDENSEDLIDWTPDDEVDLSSYPPASVQPVFTPINQAHSNETEAPALSQHSPFLPTTPSDLTPAQPQFETTNQHHDESLNQPWDDLARPLSSCTIPTSLDSLRTLFTPHEDDSEKQYAEKLNALETLAQQEYGMTLVNLDEAKEIESNKEQLDSAVASLEEARGELGLSRRDLATRTGERNGARQRIAILEDEVKEREMRELQLREELRLEREEDPLADKLFVELSELRTRCEELEEDSRLFSELQILFVEVDAARVVAERDLVLVQQRLLEAELVAEEHRTRIAGSDAQQARIEREMAVMRKECDAAGTALAESELIRREFRDRIAGFDADEARKEGDVRLAYQRLEEAAALAAEQRENLAELEEQRLDFEKYAAALRAEIAQLTTGLAATKEALEMAKSSKAKENSSKIKDQQEEIERLRILLKDTSTTTEELHPFLVGELAATKQELWKTQEDCANDPAIKSQLATMQDLQTEVEELKDQLKKGQGCEEELKRLTTELAAAEVELKKTREDKANGFTVDNIRLQLDATRADVTYWQQQHYNDVLEKKNTINSQDTRIQDLSSEIKNLKVQLKKSQRCQDELKLLTADLATTKEDLIRCQEICANDPAVNSEETRIQSLTTELEEATTSLALAQTEGRNAVAAAEQARDEAVESCRTLEAANEMVTQLRQISAENIRELVIVREERDGALHDVARLIHELHSAAEAARREGKDAWDENQMLTERFVEAERRAGEYGRQVMECEERVENLKRLVRELRDNVAKLEDAVPPPPVAPVNEEASSKSPVSPQEPDSPAMFVPRSKPKVKVERVEPGPSGGEGSGGAIPAERRSTRRTRNLAPVYVDPESPPDSPALPRKQDRKRRRGKSEDGERERKRKR